MSYKIKTIGTRTWLGRFFGRAPHATSPTQAELTRPTLRLRKSKTVETVYTQILINIPVACAWAWIGVGWYSI